MLLTKLTPSFNSAETKNEINNAKNCVWYRKIKNK